MGFTSMSIEGNFSISTILVPTVQERQNQATVHFRLLSQLFYVLPASWNQISDVRVLWERFLQFWEEVWSVAWSHTRRNARSSQSSFSFLKLISVSHHFSKLSDFCPIPRKSVEQMSWVFQWHVCHIDSIGQSIRRQIGQNRPKPEIERFQAIWSECLAFGIEKRCQTKRPVSNFPSSSLNNS